MRICRIWLIFLLLGAYLGSVEGKAEEGWRTDERNKEVVLKYLRPALGSAGGVGRLYYTTACRGNGDGYRVSFPKMKAQAAAKAETDLAAVRSVFRNTKEAVVTKDQSGIVRIRIGNPGSVILQTQIHSLTLDSLDRYNPGLAVAAIQEANEVKAAAHDLGLELPTIVTGMNVVQPAEGLPHLPASLKDLTVDQALDLVAKTFRGIVSFGVCAGPNRAGSFTMEFF